MGCWNKTCGLSNMHITAGTPVYVFVLEWRSNGISETCYTTSMFAPLLLPFESEYNDYGGGENSTGVGLPYIMQALRNELVEVGVGENQYHDIAVKRDVWSEELFFEAVHEGRLRIQSHRNKDGVPVTFTMMRKDVVDHLLSTRPLEQYVGDGKGNLAKWGDSKDYRVYTFADVVADVKPVVKEIFEIAEQAKTASKDDYSAAFRAHSLQYMFRWEDRGKNLAADWLSYDSYRYSKLISADDLMRMCVDANDPDQLELLFTDYLKGVFIDGFMSEARKIWIPGGHEGSQSSSDAALMQLYEATKVAIKNERARWSEDEGEEEESVDE